MRMALINTSMRPFSRLTQRLRPGNWLKLALVAARFSGGSNVPACLALILSCVTDRLVNAECSTRLTWAWQAEHHQHPWAGHVLPHDDADWVCQRIAA